MNERPMTSEQFVRYSAVSILILFLLLMLPFFVDRAHGGMVLDAPVSVVNPAVGVKILGFSMSDKQIGVQVAWVDAAGESVKYQQVTLQKEELQSVRSEIVSTPAAFSDVCDAVLMRAVASRLNLKHGN